MTVQYTTKFLKQLSHRPSADRSRIERFVFSKLPTLASLGNTGKIERMVGHPGFYKIRFGDYRVGLQQQGDTLILKAVMHRKDIYKYFP
jgi:mRNA interferase RelE/StbE